MLADFCGLQRSIGPNSAVLHFPEEFFAFCALLAVQALLDLWHLAPLTGDLRCDIAVWL